MAANGYQCAINVCGVAAQLWRNLISNNVMAANVSALAQ